MGFKIIYINSEKIAERIFVNLNVSFGFKQYWGRGATENE